MDRKSNRWGRSINRAITFPITVDVAEGERFSSFIDQLDPELRAVLEKVPADRPMNLNEIPAARAEMKKMMDAALASLPAMGERGKQPG